MGLIDFFKGNSSKPHIEQFKTRQTDEFVDSILLELKSVSAQAVKQAIESRESRYMKSVLDESYFLLDSLVISPRDREVAKKFEEFLSTHESVDTEFRKKFFQQIIQREYRSSRGSSVRVPNDFEATVQLGTDSLESSTSEEGFQISLKGRRISFEVVASLSGPFKREVTSSRFGKALSTPPTAVNQTFPQTEVFNRSNSKNTQSAIVVEIQVKDALGNRKELLTLPALIGREPTPSSDQFGFSPFKVNSTYVSRSQLIILEIMDQVYYYLPESASLSCMREDGLILEKLKLYPLKHKEAVNLRTGIPSEGTTQISPSGSHAEYASIQIFIENASPQNHDGTPRPKAVA
jgi:hypothetical protein